MFEYLIIAYFIFHEPIPQRQRLAESIRTEPRPKRCSCQGWTIQRPRALPVRAGGCRREGPRRVVRNGVSSAGLEFIGFMRSGSGIRVMSLGCRNDPNDNLDSDEYSNFCNFSSSADCVWGACSQYHEAFQASMGRSSGSLQHRERPGPNIDTLKYQLLSGGSDPRRLLPRQPKQRLRERFPGIACTLDCGSLV